MAILGEDEVRAALAGRRSWRRHGDALVRERTLRDFSEALRFAERIGAAADDWGRHPDIGIIGGNRVRVTVTNQNGAGFTDAELRLVAMVDEVADAPLPAPASASASVDGPAPAAPAVARASAAAAVAAVPEAAARAPEPQPARKGRGRLIALVAAGIGALAAGVGGVLASRRR
jgi:pterin-4a-carbinolamine dehydratase